MGGENGGSGGLRSQIRLLPDCSTLLDIRIFELPRAINPAACDRIRAKAAGLRVGGFKLGADQEIYVKGSYTLVLELGESGRHKTLRQDCSFKVFLPVVEQRKAQSGTGRGLGKPVVAKLLVQQRPDGSSQVVVFTGYKLLVFRFPAGLLCVPGEVDQGYLQEQVQIRMERIPPSRQQGEENITTTGAVPEIFPTAANGPIPEQGTAISPDEEQPAADQHAAAVPSQASESITAVSGVEEPLLPPGTVGEEKNSSLTTKAVSATGEAAAVAEKQEVTDGEAQAAGTAVPRILAGISGGGSLRLPRDVEPTAWSGKEAVFSLVYYPGGDPAAGVFSYEITRKVKLRSTGIRSAVSVGNTVILEGECIAARGAGIFSGGYRYTLILTDKEASGREPPVSLKIYKRSGCALHTLPSTALTRGSINFVWEQPRGDDPAKIGPR